MVDVAVLGARGYLGRLLVSFLSQHPDVAEVRCASQRSGPLGQYLPGLDGLGIDLVPPEEAVKGAEVVFNATHGEPPGDAKIEIDLGRTHRLAGIQRQEWTYGMVEVNRDHLKGATRIANPGCYPTATLLPLHALVNAGLIKEGPVVVNGVSGVSGAGAAPRGDLHYPEMNETVRAYKVQGHDHEAEMLGFLAHEGLAASVVFVPRLAPMNRGLHIVATARAPTGTTTEEARSVLQDAWADEPFLHVVDEPSTHHVRGTNRLHATVDVRHGTLIVRSAIDNLVKGGAGQAVQNMNLALGLDETIGLPNAGVGV